MSWKTLESQSPGIAEFGNARLHNKVAYLAKVRIAPYDPAERYILFEFDVESVVMTEYQEGQAIHKCWKIDA
jgi:hypothetical protein